MPSLQVNEQNLAELASSCAEFLVHGVDVEGKQLGIDEQLIRLLGSSTPIPTTYAGGVRSMVCVDSWCMELPGSCMPCPGSRHGCHCTVWHECRKLS